MLSSIWLPCAILIVGCTSAINQTTDTSNSSSLYVPLLIKTVTLSANATALSAAPGASNNTTREILINVHSLSASNTFQKVPLRRNATENISPYPPQTPASVFIANYNNQQNVMQLVKNLNVRLKNIRNVEMRVPAIQEIFDSMHFNSAPVSHVNRNSTLQQQLQTFSKRLAKKLQKATHIVYDLRDFFRLNVTRFLQLPESNSEYAEDEDADVDFDLELEDFDGSSTSEDPQQFGNYSLHTIIQACQSTRAFSELSFDNEEIQILNYLKTDHKLQPQFNEHLTGKQHQFNERSMQANAYIADKLEILKNTLTITDGFESTTSRNAIPKTNTKLKFQGNHYKHIYFLSHSDDASDRNKQYNYDMQFRYLYAAAIKSKFVFLLLDVGSAINTELLELTKAYVNNILQLLSDTDLISIATVDDKAQTIYFNLAGSEDSSGVYFATRHCKDEISTFVNSLSAAKTLTNHSCGFEYAFKTLSKLQNESVITVQNPIVFVYVTRGLLTNLTDTMHVLNVIASGQKYLTQPIVINTCAIVCDEKRIMYEKQFLSDICMQNFTKYGIKVDDWYNPALHGPLAGKFFILTKTQPDGLLRASAAVFSHVFVEPYLVQSLQVHLPVMNPNSKDMIVPITHPVAPFGVVGVNLYLSDLIEDIMSYRQQSQQGNKNEFSYAFLMDVNGVTIAHPAFPRPMTQNQISYPVDIGFLENSTDFTNIRHRMLHEENGNITTTVYSTNNKKTELLERTYKWNSILGIYILCLVSTVKKELVAANKNISADINVKAAFQMPTSLPLALRYTLTDDIPQFHQAENEYLPTMDLLYHRIDLVPPPNGQVCRYFRQVCTMDAATLFLSSSAFESPFTFLHNNRISSQQSQTQTVESIMAYIKDTTGLLANPGLRSEIRGEVNALYSAMQRLKKRHQDTQGALRNYIIRRYIATVNGVLQVFPGCLLSNDYDPTRRPWFRKAMQQPGRIITTEPYLDAGGAGYIITIAHTILEGKANALHSIERDQPIAIVALDLPYTYYYKMILDTTPVCHLNNIKCLLFENEGYLIAHPSMLEVSTGLRNQRRPYEHLTHKESYLANDILNHKTLVKKLACANYQNRTLQRYYVFNTSLTEILSNVVQGERTKYAIALVRGSNIFAAVLNSTCDGGAFCPCSTIDRICLNCNRMDQTDCECPCECPMEMDVFDEAATVAGSAEVGSGPFSNYTQQYAYCESPNEYFVALPTPAEYNLLHACVNINCDIYGTQNECLAVVGCEWCQQDADGISFTASFCTAQAACFNGVLSALTPYGDLDDLDIIAAHGFIPGQKPNSYSAFGPVGGAIVVLGIVIGFAIYCYRHNLETHAQDQFYIDSMQEENYGLPLSRFNFDDCQAHDEPPGGGYDHPAGQRNLIHPADISPYHMSTGSSYRRPPNGESDHGYSTMTPHEDSSDHQCFTLAEPLLLNDKRNSKSDTMSISTSISSPTNRHQHHHHTHNTYLNPTPTSNKDTRYNVTSPKKYHSSTPSPARVYEQTTLPLNDSTEDSLSPHYILAPVTVHRHMETSES